jgi:hypothetical protein
MCMKKTKSLKYPAYPAKNGTVCKEINLTRLPVYRLWSRSSFELSTAVVSSKIVEKENPPHLKRCFLGKSTGLIASKDVGFCKFVDVFLSKEP